ncbi:leucine-rich repeat serine/threonine-protein kinase 1-like protein, partial [Euroglyphus maynei]
SLSRSRLVQVSNTNNKNSLLGYNLGPITFRTWDFGGQREYYATHQYFLSKRAIYLVIWKITDGEKGVIGIHNWLVNIQSRAPNSPVIIVGTHYDLVKEFYPPFYANELQNMISDRYMSDAVDADKRGLPKVVASVEVSIKTRHNIRLLANIIYETAIEMRSPGGKDRLLEQKVPATYLALEEIVSILALERKSENLEPVLHADQYRQEVARMMKERYDLVFRDYSELQQATRFLHENGVLLHYEDAHLKDLYFLDPQWLCDILAHVVTIREINPFVKNGIMKTEHLLQLFKNTHNAPMDVQSYLLGLLNKFELAITWDNRTLLIPSLLPTEEQLRAGYLGWDIAIPLRSRLKIRNHLANDSWKNAIKFNFSNELSFQEFNDSQNNKVKSNDAKSETFPLCKVTAMARHNQSILRILILSYVPSGFWSRLIARVLADESVIDIVRSFYSLPSYAHNDPLLIDFLNNVKTFWYCWQTGFGLRYLDTFLLRVKEFSLINNTNLESKFVSSSTFKNYSYPYDYNRIKFYLSQRNDNKQKSKSTEWCEIDISSQSSSLIEIYLPNQTLQVETCHYQEMKNENENRFVKNSYTLEPNMEMLTKLLVIIVEHIDTLLEDWYPSL